MTLQDYTRILRKRWSLIVALPLLCVAVASFYIVHSTKMYTASAQIFVSTAGSDGTTAADLAQGNTFTQARVQSYTSVATSPAVTQKVISALGLKMTPEHLASEITATAPLNKVLINIAVTDASPALAANLANAVSTQFSAVVAELETTAASTTSAVKLTVTHPASVPTTPVSPKPKLDFAISVLLGLVLGLGLAFLREAMDNTIKNPKELADESGIAVLGVIPRDKKIARAAIAFRADAHGIRAEGYRQMRTNLQFIDVDNPPRVLTITSAVAGEGKTHTALNLAAALAEAGMHVCLIEADLRRPSLARLLGIVGDVGVTSILVHRTPVIAVMQNAGANLAVITAGDVPPNPSELINSDAFLDMVHQVRELVDFVVIDTPPLLPVADGAQLAALADAAVLVVRAEKTKHDQVRRAIVALEHVGVKPVGTVLSMAPVHGSGYVYYEEYRPSRASRRAKSHRAEPQVQDEAQAASIDSLH